VRDAEVKTLDPGEAVLPVRSPGQDGHATESSVGATDAVNLQKDMLLTTEAQRPSAAEPQPNCATAILAVPGHGLEARATRPLRAAKKPGNRSMEISI
jgi:hypothetical protein